MVMVVFEVRIKEAYRDNYLEHSAELRKENELIPGLISSEGFSSLYEDGKVLSLRSWEDVEAANKWRNVTEHRLAQKKGREVYFESYRITVLKSLRSYTLEDRSEAPRDSNDFFGLE